MGCLSSRNSTISPSDMNESSSKDSRTTATNGKLTANNQTSNNNYNHRQASMGTRQQSNELSSGMDNSIRKSYSIDRNEDDESGAERAGRGTFEQRTKQEGNSKIDGGNNNIEKANQSKLMMEAQDDENSDFDKSLNNKKDSYRDRAYERLADTSKEQQEKSDDKNDEKKDSLALVEYDKSNKMLDNINTTDNDESIIKREPSTDDETNIELLKQYVAVDYEITQLEDKDTLMVYHEKIEQLEQLERELDMISKEAEEVAVRSEGDSQLDRVQSSLVSGGNQINNGNNNNRSTSSNGIGMTNKTVDAESNSMSGATGSIISHKSWLGPGDSVIKNNKDKQYNMMSSTNSSIKQQTNINSNTRNIKKGTGSEAGAANNNNINNNNNNNNTNNTNSNSNMIMMMNMNINNNNSSIVPYSSVEEVFNRKIILEKERDKLKKEVELVIIECDKLQQRYKKRDEILDKLFDGKPGNGLENHLEQQLNWLLEQKHYVDQVFYSWKRAETLTSQTCEQFASALELLKRLPKIQQTDQREELAKLIGNLLIKSRQDMEQAQKYNPNVDAPFFTDNETERFDKIIETISSNSINASEYSQILTVIQFAYKRAVSIRLWLEQILQTTIARDSFELAEEYKWIAIQLRKERIKLIKLKLQDEPYHSMAQSVLEEIVRQQTIVERRQQQEINRDSGVESETNDIDIEEEIYRLLELNKARLEESINNGTTSGQVGPSSMSQQQQQLKVSQQQILSSSSSDSQQRQQSMRERIENRIQGKVRNNDIMIPNMIGNGQQQQKQQQQGDNSQAQSSSGVESAKSTNKSASSITSIGTPTKLRIELDEVARQNLLKQVDQIHNKHKSRIDRLKGTNKAKANNFIRNRLQEVRQQVPGSENDSEMIAAAYGLN